MSTLTESIEAEQTRAEKIESDIQNTINIQKPIWDDTNAKKHTHSNKTVLDGITSTLITAWNNAVSASDCVTPSERTLWNTISNKVDKISGKGLSTNDYTNTDKAELSALTDEIGEHTKNNTIHITSTEKNTWNAKVGKTDSISDNTVHYTESSVLSELSSGEKMSVAYGKLKSAVKNVIANVKLLGTTDISAIGDGTVTGAVSALNSNLDQKLNRVNNSLTITSVKETPSNSTGYSTSNFLAETPKGSGTTNRCGYGFHYPGVIGGLLTMNPNDGLLYFVTHNGYTYKIDMTKQ